MEEKGKGKEKEGRRDKGNGVRRWREGFNWPTQKFWRGAPMLLSVINALSVKPRLSAKGLCSSVSST